MEVLYFAWLKDRTGTAAEAVRPPAEVRDVAGLIGWLKTRSDGHAAAFAQMDAIRAAVNQEFAALDHPVAPGDEVAFFPPMTGG